VTLTLQTTRSFLIRSDDSELTSKATGGLLSDVFNGMGSHPIGVPYNSGYSSSSSPLGAATAGDGGIGAGLGSGLLTGAPAAASGSGTASTSASYMSARELGLARDISGIGGSSSSTS